MEENISLENLNYYFKVIDGGMNSLTVTQNVDKIEQFINSNEYDDDEHLE